MYAQDPVGGLLQQLGTVEKKIKSHHEGSCEERDYQMA